MDLYITRGISESIAPILQIEIWNAIARIPIEKDYLQIFNVKPYKGITIIEHKQEVPEYSCVLYFTEVEVRKELKVYVEISTEYITMMLAEER